MQYLIWLIIVGYAIKMRFRKQEYSKPKYKVRNNTNPVYVTNDIQRIK